MILFSLGIDQYENRESDLSSDRLDTMLSHTLGNMLNEIIFGIW